MTHAGRLLMVIVASFATGCSSTTPKPKPAPATRPVTDVDPNLATPEYWINQPAVTWVPYPTYSALYNACQDVARDRGFSIDRLDYRTGVVTTRPLISAQIFEPWRRDVVTPYEVDKSSLASMRRTIRFEITKQADGSYELTPKVLVERKTTSERRITSAMYFRDVNAPTNAYGTKETDEGVVLPTVYWYAVGRDKDLERTLSAEIYEKLYGK